MRVLVNAISARQGGIVTYTSNLIRSFAQRQVDAVFAVPSSFPDPELLPTVKVDVHSFSLIRRAVWEQTSWRRMVRHCGPDVLFSSANYALLKSPVPQVLLVREGGLFDPNYLVNVAPELGVKAAAIRQVRRAFMMQSIRHSHALFTPTSAMRTLIANWAPGLVENCDVNTYGTIDSAFRPAERPRRWREDGKLRMLYVSVYYPHKNPGELIDAAIRLDSAGLQCRLRLTMELDAVANVAGSALDTALIQRGLSAGLVTLQPAPYGQLPELYHQADVFVFPSLSETFGHPMVEAMACGLPVIAADTAVNREVLGDAALYYRPHRPNELVDAIRRLDQEPFLRADLVARGIARATDCFSWEAHVDRLIDTLATAAAKGRVR